MNKDEEFVDMSFPRGGMDRSMGFDRQPTRPAAGGEYAHTTPQGVNVRAYEPSTGRARGGSRSGLVRYIDARVSNLALIQDLAIVVITGDTGDPEPPDPGGGGT